MKPLAAGQMGLNPCQIRKSRDSFSDISFEKMSIVKSPKVQKDCEETRGAAGPTHWEAPVAAAVERLGEFCEPGGSQGDHPQLLLPFHKTEVGISSFAEQLLGLPQSPKEKMQSGDPHY